MADAPSAAAVPVPTPTSTPLTPSAAAAKKEEEDDEIVEDVEIVVGRTRVYDKKKMKTNNKKKNAEEEKKGGGAGRQRRQQDGEGEGEDGDLVPGCGGVYYYHRQQQGHVGTLMYKGPVQGHVGTYYGVVWDDFSRGKHDGSVVVDVEDDEDQEEDEDEDSTTDGDTAAAKKTNNKNKTRRKKQKELRRYFDAGHPTAGSLVRPDVVGFGRLLTRSVVLERYRNVCGGVSIGGGGGDDDVDAGTGTVDYCYDDYDEQEQNQQQHTVTTASGKSKPIEFVGVDKILRQQRWSKLEHVSLRCMGLAGVYGGELENEEFEALRHLQHVDVACNLFSDWSVLPRLLRAFPNLRRLSLAKNRMVDDTAAANFGAGAGATVETFPNLTYLNLRDCHVRSFATVAAIARLAPNLRELCVAYSHLDDVVVAEVSTETTMRHQREEGDGDDGDGDREPILNNLRVLDVSKSTGLQTPGQLEAFARHCPNLRSLSLNDVPLTEWPAAAACWPHLAELQLDGDTRFENWDSLRPLLKLPLESLRFSASCPCAVKYGPSAAVRLQFIAALPTLKQYQSSTITDRAEIERQYVLREAAAAAAAAAAASAASAAAGRENGDATSDQPSKRPLGLLRPEDERYRELMNEYAELVERRRANGVGAGGDENSSGTMMLFSTVTVQITSLCPSSCTAPPLARKLPLRLTVGRLKAMCARHFDLDTDLQHLQWRRRDASSGGGGGRTTLPVDFPRDDDDATLQDCGLADGAEIFVKELDVGATTLRRRQHETGRRDLLERVQQQERERFDMEKRMAAVDRAGC